MTIEITNWNTIKHLYVRSDILIGNGASIAVNQGFTYGSLRQVAIDNGLPENANKLFSSFETEDFELILRLVWQAKNVNIALDIDDHETNEAYEQVRDSLIRSVRNSHPEHRDVNEQIPNIYNFLKQFKTIISLNYDLILYWTMMYGREQNDFHTFKDCFINSVFDDNWRRLRNQVYERTNSLVFYPHGSLILARDVLESEIKLRTNEEGLLDSILNQWESGRVVPLFVSEGTSQQKLRSIRSSYYLNTVYREVLPSVGNRTLVIFGWGFGEHDLHILKRISSFRILPVKIAVSVYANDQAFCYRVIPILKHFFGANVLINFFDSNSDGCWNNA